MTLKELFDFKRTRSENTELSSCFPILAQPDKMSIPGDNP